MASLNDVVVRIIKEQQLVIGPLAWTEASKVQGLRVSEKDAYVEFLEHEQGLVVDRLVAQYERLFGRASHEVCREAAAPLLSGLAQAEIPASLR